MKNLSELFAKSKFRGLIVGQKGDWEQCNLCNFDSDYFVLCLGSFFLTSLNFAMSFTQRNYFDEAVIAMNQMVVECRLPVVNNKPMDNGQWLEKYNILHLVASRRNIGQDPTSLLELDNDEIDGPLFFNKSLRGCFIESISQENENRNVAKAQVSHSDEDIQMHFDKNLQIFSDSASLSSDSLWDISGEDSDDSKELFLKVPVHTLPDPLDGVGCESNLQHLSGNVEEKGVTNEDAKVRSRAKIVDNNSTAEIDNCIGTSKSDSSSKISSLTFDGVPSPDQPILKPFHEHLLEDVCSKFKSAKTNLFSENHENVGCNSTIQDFYDAGMFGFPEPSHPDTKSDFDVQKSKEPDPDMKELQLPNELSKDVISEPFAKSFDQLVMIPYVPEKKTDTNISNETADPVPVIQPGTIDSVDFLFKMSSNIPSVVDEPRYQPISKKRKPTED